jgi:hypothetical protein
MTRSPTPLRSRVCCILFQFVEILWPSRDNKTVPSIPGREFLESGCQTCEPFLRSNISKKKHGLIGIANIQSPLCFRTRQAGVRYCVVNPERDNANRAFGNPKLERHFAFHSHRYQQKYDRSTYTEHSVTFDSVHESFSSRLARINVVGRKYHAFAQQFLVQHQQCAVEQLKLVIPEDMKQLWSRRRRVDNKSGVILSTPSAPLQWGLRLVGDRPANYEIEFSSCRVTPVRSNRRCR